MDDVRRIPGTIIRNRIYYLQRRVPADMVEAFGFPHFKKSLGTSDFHEAKRRLNTANVELDEEIERKRESLRSGEVLVVPPTPLKLNALKSRLREYANSEAALRRSALDARRWQQVPGSRATARAELVTTIEALCQPKDEFTVQRLKEVAGALFPENRFDQPELGSIHNFWHPINGPFRTYLRRALLDIERRTLHYLNGDFSGAGLDAMFRLQVPATPSDAPPAAGHNSQNVSLAELSRLRLAEHAKGSVREQRRAQLAAAHDLILRYFRPDTPAASLTPEKCAEFRDALAELPRDITKRFASTEPLDAIAAHAKQKKLRTMARSTQETYLGALRDMMEWGVKHQWNSGITRNPAATIRSLTLDRPRARVDFDEDLLTRICQEPFMCKWNRMNCTPGRNEGLADATRYWVPRIALFTGMRQTEICQLDIADIRTTRSGVAYFFVNDDAPDKQLKNAASRKAVPIHKQLLEAGFLVYVAAVTKAGHKKLFPDLKPSKFGHHGAQLSKWITRQMRSAGYPTGVDFHAFRHTFAQALRQADAPPEVAARLGGWSINTGVMARYGNALSDRWIDHMNSVLQKVHYGKAEPHIF